MRILFYVFVGFVGLFIVPALIGAQAGKNAAQTAANKAPVKTPSAPTCVVDLDKFNAMKDGMSYFQIERDVGCPGTKASTASYGNTTMYKVTWKGQGSFGANMYATFRNDKLIGKAQYGLQ
jgi:hypothetical protein